jgi:hypothetical protein
MHRILAPGGVWINLGKKLPLPRRPRRLIRTGPLLWHFENNSTNDTSIELTLEEVKAAARAIGFKVQVSSLPRLRPSLTRGLAERENGRQHVRQQRAGHAAVCV